MANRNFRQRLNLPQVLTVFNLLRNLNRLGWPRENTR
jgi:hypothetical protein